MTIVSDSEVLEHEPDGWRPGARLKIVVAVILVLGIAGFVADRKQREDEGAALTGCSRAIDGAIESALGPVDAMVAYVRPTRDGAPAELVDELDAMVAGQTANASKHLAPVEEACSGIQVLGYHGVEKAKKRDCLARLAAASEYFADLANDGSMAFQSRVIGGRSLDC